MDTVEPLMKNRNGGRQRWECLVVTKRLEMRIGMQTTFMYHQRPFRVINDGLKSYSAPSVDGQERDYRSKDAEAEPETVTHIEAHGTKRLWEILLRLAALH